MAQEKIRKGFFFYFGMFVLLLITVFFICLVVMMFNPGQTVLWMQYFTGDGQNVYITSTNAKDKEDISINWANVTDLEIRCSYADVKIDRNKNSKLTKDGLYINNSSKGFCGAAGAVPYEYKVYYEGPKLIVEVKESQGFLFFSKDVQITLHASTERSMNFDNLNLTVKTTEGDVEVGGTTVGETDNVKLASLNVETTTGDIAFTDKFDFSSLNSDKALSLKTTDGDILSTKKVLYTNSKGATQEANGMVLGCDAKFVVDGKGKVNVNRVSGNLELTCARGVLDIDYISAAKTSVACIEGNHMFGEVYGDLSYTNSADTILAPNIIVDYLKGDFILSTDGNAQAEPDIDIKKIDGAVSVISDKGEIDIKQASGAIDIDGKNMKINLIFAENFGDVINIVNEGGKVELGFIGTVPNGAKVKTTGGDVILNFTDTARFKVVPVKNDGSSEALSKDNISVNIGSQKFYNQTDADITIDGGSDVVNVITNAKLWLNLVAKATLTA